MPERLIPPEDLTGLSLAEIATLAAEQRLPPVERWNPPHCGHSRMRIAADGGWWHEGRSIERPALVRLFATLLRREADGGHMLVTPVEKLTIDVDDTPFVAVEVASEGAGPARRLAFRLNTGDLVVAGAAHLLAMRDGRPILQVRAGLEARVERAPFYEIAEMALGEGGQGVWSDGAFFPLDAA